MEDDEEIGSYMFRRTVPSMHITPDDVRFMVYALLPCDSYNFHIFVNIMELF